MATRREVELVIKARDQAKQAVDGIVDSLQRLSTSQERLGKSGGVANTALERLAVELNTLQKNAQGLTVLNRVATQMDRAAKESTRLQTSLQATQRQMAEVSLRASDAAARYGELSAASRNASESLARERNTLAALKTEQNQIAEAVRRATTEYRGWLTYSRQKKDLTDQERFAMRAARDTLIGLLETQQRQRAVVTAQGQAVSQAGAAYRALSRETEQTRTEMVAVNREFEKTVLSARAEAGALEQVDTALGEMRTAAQSAANALGGVDVKQEAIADSSQRTAAAISRVSEALARQQAAARAAGGAGGAGGAQQTESAFKRQQAAVEAARQAFRTAREELARLKGEFAAAEAPSAALSAELLAARTNAQLAGQAWRDQIAALDVVRGKLRESAAATQQKANADRQAQVAAAAAADAAFHRARAEQAGAVAARLLGKDVETMNQRLRGTGAAAGQAAEGVRRFGDQSRRALSVVQRIRGEFLSLATSVVGLYGIFNQTGEVIDAIRTVEAAASRLTAVFDGDQAAVRGELRFLSQEADRLGLSFRVLSQEYGRFAIAADAANFSNDSTRRIFISVAEAARVNKASVEELEGTFLALQQMVSKGTVSMEELRRQLGDRLPGAFNIFAEAIGVTTAELDKMLRAGEVRASETTLLKFAEELERRFGGALPAALETVTTQLDRFQNNLFEARARIGEGGFTDALEESLTRLNEFFRSREGRDFFLEIGALLGNLVRTVAFVVQNFEMLARVFQAFVSVRIAQMLQTTIASMTGVRAAATGLTGSFLALDAAQQKQAVSAAAQVSASGALLGTLRLLTGQAAAVAVAIATTGRSSAATAAAMAGMAAAARGVAIAFTAVLRALGPIALAATAVFALSSLFLDMGTNVPDATRALDEHNRILSEYEAEATRAERAGRAFNASLVDVDPMEARGTYEELKAAFGGAVEESTKAAEGIIRDWRNINREFRNSEGINAISALTKRLQDGEITVFEYQTALREMADQLQGPSAGALQGLIAHLIRSQDELKAQEEATIQADIVTRRLSGDTQDLTAIYARFGVEVDSVTGRIRGLTNAMEEQARRAAQIGELRDQIVSGIPERAQAAEREAARTAIDDREARVRALTEEGAERNELLGLIEEERAALKKKQDEEDARDARRGARSRNTRDEQREFNKELERTIALRRFEIEQIGRSRRDQEIEQALFQARARATERNVTLSAQQVEQLREATGAAYDAAEAERIRLAIIEQEAQMRALLHEQLSVDEELRLEATRQHIDLLTEEGQAWGEVTRRIIERTRAEERLRKQVQDVTALERQRQESIEEFEAARAAGELNAEGRASALAEIERQRIEIEAARVAALELAQALGDEQAIARLERMNSKLSEQQQKVREIRTDLINMLADGLTNATMQIGEEIGKVLDGTQKWSDALANVGNAFRQFAADFLKEIAKMIIQQAILRALQNSSGGGGWVGAIANVVAGMHDGGIVGRDRTFTRRVDPRIFANAKRFHGGGLPGIRRDEVPTILQKGEQVLAKDDPNNILNGGGGQQVRIINAINPEEFMDKGLNSPVGTKTFLNWIRSNRQAVTGALGN